MPYKNTILIELPHNQDLYTPICDTDKPIDIPIPLFLGLFDSH